MFRDIPAITLELSSCSYHQNNFFRKIETGFLYSFNWDKWPGSPAVIFLFSVKCILVNSSLLLVKTPSEKCSPGAGLQRQVISPCPPIRAPARGPHPLDKHSWEKNNTYRKKKADYVHARSVHEGAVVWLFVRTFIFLPGRKSLCTGMPTNDPTTAEFELFLRFDFSNFLWFISQFQFFI